MRKLRARRPGIPVREAHRPAFLSVAEPSNPPLAAGASAATFAGMNSEGLDVATRKRIADQLRHQLWYLDRLTGRMHQKLFPTDDPLRAAGERARVAMQELYDVAKRLAQ